MDNNTFGTRPRRAPASRMRRGRGGRLRRMAGVAAATSAPMVLWLATVPGLGVDLDVATGPGGPDVVVGLPAVVVSALATCLIGWALLELLERWSRFGTTAWAWIAGIAAVLSLGGPLATARSGTALLVLAGMHLLTAIVLIAVLAPRVPRTGNRTDVAVPRAGRAGATEAR